MAHQSDSLMSKTQKGLSILAFETNKQSRILKRRMQIAALQKEIKADLRALGNLIYNAFINEQKDVMEDEDVRILAENIHRNKDEIERLRDMIARLGRAKKHFPEEDEGAGLHKYDVQEEGPRPDDEVETVAEADASVEPVPETKVDPVVDEEPDKPEKKSKKSTKKDTKTTASKQEDADEVPLEPEEEEKDAAKASGSED